MKFKAFIFKYRLFWICWVLYDGTKEEHYYDNRPTTTIAKSGVKYFALSLTEKSANRKIVKYCSRILEKEGAK